MNRLLAISKTLSANDVGASGSHQAGILIPKNPRVVGFFPRLEEHCKNPRRLIRFTDEAGACWELCFIYYNNALFGGTRNEYRLTRMTAFVRAWSLAAGDDVTFLREESGKYMIRCRSAVPQPADAQEILKLGRTWRVVSF